MKLGEDHFAACTNLLNAHRCERGIVSGDVVNVVASDSKFGVRDEVVVECTQQGGVEGHVMEGVTHWDVVVGVRNVGMVSSIMKEKMEQHRLAESMVRSAVPVLRVFRSE